MVPGIGYLRQMVIGPFWQLLGFWLNIFDLRILNDLLSIVNYAGMTYNT